MIQVDAVRRFNRFYTRRVGALGEGHLQSPYSLTEVRVLYEIANRDGITATELGERLGLDAGYLSRILARFQERGMVTRSASEKDARQSHLSLTDAGREAFANLNRAAAGEIEGMHLTALACAREALVGAMRPDLVAYVSEQGHSSLARSCRVLGFRPDQVRVLPVDDCWRMRIDALTASMQADLDAGRRPLAVLAVAGTTSTGAVDDLTALAETCRRHGVWLHVDAAHGASALLSPGHRHRLRGIERARSVAWDPHKIMLMPTQAGMLLVRDERDLDTLYDWWRRVVGYCEMRGIRPTSVAEIMESVER